MLWVRARQLVATDLLISKVHVHGALAALHWHAMPCRGQLVLNVHGQRAVSLPALVGLRVSEVVWYGRGARKTKTRPNESAVLGVSPGRHGADRAQLFNGFL